MKSTIVTHDQVLYDTERFKLMHDMPNTDTNNHKLPRKELAESTIQQYKYFLTRFPNLNMINPGETFETLLKTKQTRGKLSDQLISISCIKIVISAIIWKLSQENNKKNDEIIKKYKYYIAKLRDITTKTDIDHSHNAENVPEWNTIIEKREELLTNGKYKHHLLLSLYTYIAPRRLKDYVLLKVSDDPTYALNKNDPEIIKFNYYLVDSNKLIFNNYKTKKTYFQQIIEIPDTLKNILMNYIHVTALSDGDTFFNCKSYHALHYMLIYLIGTGVDNIRHSYVNETYKSYSIPENEVLEENAKKMGHSLQTHLRYRKMERNHK